MRIKDRICETPNELLSSSLFEKVLANAIKDLERRKSIMLHMFTNSPVTQYDIELLKSVLKYLVKMPLGLIPNLVKGAQTFVENKELLFQFIEYLYNYWRHYDRFIICDAAGDPLDERPYRTFTNTIEKLTHLVRCVYRDIQENITGDHPNVYRQVRAGAEFAAIALPKQIPMPQFCAEILQDVPIIRQVLLNPPLVIYQPNNKRTGQFVRVVKNPIDYVDIVPDEWLCYPAKVGDLVILAYFHEKFFELGFSLANLFEIATDEELAKRPHGVYLYGVDRNLIDGLGSFPTIFYDDEAEQMLIAACPNDDMFGYFGYLKKMMLTLHNIVMMKKGWMPYHGSMTRIILDGKIDTSILLIGDTGAGKSETLEAFRNLGGQSLSDVIVIADDMGSIEIKPDGSVMGYGTEIGAFLRIDDLSPGAAFGQIDRAIIMNPNGVNARIVIPVTSLQRVIQGTKIDFVLYANNFEQVDEKHPVIEQFSSADEALKVFREGTAMSKGTTTSTGLTHSYFANIFGPPEYKDVHEAIATRYFEQFFKMGLFIGQMRTRLGLPGFEHSGPEESAKELIKLIRSRMLP
jgi:hypothetical protein